MASPSSSTQSSIKKNIVPKPSIVTPHVQSAASAMLPEGFSGQPSTLSQAGRRVTVPGFISKLYRILADHAFAPLIHWTADGCSFIVARPDDFARRVLPAFFKHNNFSSFVRQLNMYGFHKVQQPASGSALTSTGGGVQMLEFANDSFQRDHPEKLVDIRRKTGKEGEDLPLASVFDSNSQGALSVQRLLSEIRTLRMQQATIQQKLAAIQADSQHIWAENQLARERAAQQQQLIDRIIRFLASVFSGSSTPSSILGSTTQSGQQQAPSLEFLATPGMQSALRGYQATGALNDILYPQPSGTATIPRKRPPLLIQQGPQQDRPHGDDDEEQLFPWDTAFQHVSTGLADTQHDIEHFEDQLLSSVAKGSPDDDRVLEKDALLEPEIDLSQYLDDYSDDELFIEPHDAVTDRNAASDGSAVMEDAKAVDGIAKKVRSSK